MRYVGASFLIFLSLIITIITGQQSLKPHPRLIILDDQLPIILKTISIDPVVSFWFSQIQQEADTLLTTTPTQWVPGRMLTESRQVLSRVTTLSGVYRLTSNVAYANRAIDEMVAAAKMPGWCPNSFLDPSEMTNALAIGYDWLYDLISDDDKALISSAIYNKGLKYGVEFYFGNFTEDPDLAPTPLYPSGFDWSKVFFNWNQVCNGGMLMGALAVWEDYPEVANYILNSSIPSIEISISAYAPDGGWVESPTYGIYASTYSTFYLAALFSTFGTDFGITQRHPYLSGYGNYHMHTITPGLMYDSWGDSGLSASADMTLIYFDIAYEREVYGNSTNGISIFHVLFSQPQDINTFFNTQVNTSAYFEAIQVVTTRKSWDVKVNASSYYAAIKGGNTTMVLNPHQHLDLGNFIVEVAGLELVTDLGADNYSLPGYFNVSQRFSYYGTSSMGHNVYTINGNSSQQMSTAQVTEYDFTPKVYMKAVVDLSSAYYPNVTSATRALEVDLSYNTIQLVDTIFANANTKDLTWRLHSKTYMSVTETPNYNPIITFSYHDVSVQAVMLLPSGATYTVYPFNPPYPEYQTYNLHVLDVYVPNIQSTDEIIFQLTFML